MINNINYQGKIPIKKNGKIQEISIPSFRLLRHNGPLIEVTITHPSSVKKILKEYGKEIPSINVMGLIDTGAFSSVITPDVADQLNLVHTGYRSVTSVQDEQEQPVYYGYIQTYWEKEKRLN